MTKLLIALILLTGCRIPTYPKYIELKKNLTIKFNCRIEEICDYGICPNERFDILCGTNCREKEVCDYKMEYPKGTKIYYEE